MSNPSEVLAARIMERLVVEGLVRQNDAASAVSRLASGKLKAEDWRLLIENASPAHAQADLQPDTTA